MNTKRRTATIVAYLFLLFSIFSLCGCSITNLTNDGTNSSLIPYTSFSIQASSTEEIIQLLLESMYNNQNKCELLVPNEELIDAEGWLNQLVGIEQIHCEYRKVKDGFNVVITFNYWDNYAIVNAYQTNDTSKLNERQLILYNKYLEVLNQYTSPSKSDCANELAIHDYLVANIEYEEQENSTHNAYDALILGKSVCSGYAETFKTFMDLLGIENKTLSGVARDQQHIWNLVRLDGEWYQVDVTWDDPVGSTSSVIDHSYFNITDEDMALDHTWDETQNDGLTAAGIKYSYPQYAGLANITSQEQLNSYIVNVVNSQAAYVEFTTNNEFDIKTAISATDTSLSYSYKIVERVNYLIYIITFLYS